MCAGWPDAPLTLGLWNEDRSPAFLAADAFTRDRLARLPAEGFKRGSFMRTGRISVSVSMLLLAMLSSCSFEPGKDQGPDVNASTAAVTGGLIQYQGSYGIRQHPNVRVVFWRTANGIAVSDSTRAAAGPMVSAIIAGSYFDWLKAEYTTPAAMTPGGRQPGPQSRLLARADRDDQRDGDEHHRRQHPRPDQGRARRRQPRTAHRQHSTDPQLVVLVVVPASVSVGGINGSASSSSVPYHESTFGTDSIAYVIVRDDAGFLANASAGIISAILNPPADYPAEAWSSGLTSSRSGRWAADSPARSCQCSILRAR
jgi:hypothetical protein